MPVFTYLQGDADHWGIEGEVSVPLVQLDGFALIADVGRKAAAGLTEAEIAATLGADGDPRTLAIARAKLNEQRDREAAWYGAALHAAER